MRCGDLGPGQGATSEARCCPEINRYENFHPLPKAEPMPTAHGQGNRKSAPADGEISHGAVVLSSDTGSQIRTPTEKLSEARRSIFRVLKELHSSVWKMACDE
jgi:hypothetical protein